MVPTEKKIARVQPQVQQKTPGKVDPIKALSSMASQPMTSTAQAQSLSISHSAQPSHTPKMPLESPKMTAESPKFHSDFKQRSVGTQAKIGQPLKVIF